MNVKRYSRSITFLDVHFDRPYITVIGSRVKMEYKFILLPSSSCATSMMTPMTFAVVKWNSVDTVDTWCTWCTRCGHVVKCHICFERNVTLRQCLKFESRAKRVQKTTWKRVDVDHLSELPLFDSATAAPMVLSSSVLTLSSRVGAKCPLKSYDHLIHLSLAIGCPLTVQIIGPLLQENTELNRNLSYIPIISPSSQSVHLFTSLHWF